MSTAKKMGTAKKKGIVGVVGLGIMGGAFAKNLVAAGWRVIGYDIDPARRRALAKAGVEIAPDTRHLAGTVRTIITSLPKPAALEATVAAIAVASAVQKTYGVVSRSIAPAMRIISTSNA